jgi:class 3 adenylate cyclase
VEEANMALHTSSRLVESDWNWKQSVECQLHKGGGSVMPSPIKVVAPLTILWSDIKGSKELKLTKGQEYLDNLYKQHRKIVETVTKGFTPILIGTENDAVYVAFEQPEAHNAVQCAIRILEAVNSLAGQLEFKIACGISTGEVTRYEEECVGPIVDLAHSFAIAALPDAIYCDGATKLNVNWGNISSVAGEAAGRLAPQYLSEERVMIPRNFSREAKFYEVIYK